jgi:hypothetical protein
VVTPNAAVAPDGTLTADRVQFDLNGGTTTSDIANLQQNFTYVANIPYTFAVWLKSNTGVNQTLALFAFNSQGANIIVTPQWQRFTRVVTPNVSTGSSFGLRARGGQGMTTPADVLIWGGYHEQSALPPTSDIATTAAAVIRPEDKIVWPLAVFSDAQGTAYAAYQADNWATADPTRVIGNSSGGAGAPIQVRNARGGVGLYDGTNVVDGPAGVPVGIIHGASVWNAATAKARAFSNGAGGAQGGYVGTFAFAGVAIGFGGGQSFQGYIGDVVILDTALSEFDVPSLPDYEYPEIAPPIAGALTAPTALRLSPAPWWAH